MLVLKEDNLQYLWITVKSRYHVGRVQTVAGEKCQPKVLIVLYN